MSENFTVKPLEDVELEDTQEWGEMADVSGTTSEISASAATPVTLPEELRQLISSSGVCLVRCENTWKVEGWVAKLRKYLLVTFSIDENIKSEDILDGFELAGFNTEKIVSIQRQISNRSWVMSFTEQAEKDRVISKGRITIKRTMVFLSDADTCTDIVKIFEAPDKMPDTVVTGRLSCFG